MEDETSQLYHPEGQGGDGEVVGWAVVGLTDRMTVIFKEQHPRTDWLEERGQKVIGQIR